MRFKFPHQTPFKTSLTAKDMLLENGFINLSMGYDCFLESKPTDKEREDSYLVLFRQLEKPHRYPRENNITISIIREAPQAGALEHIGFNLT